MWKLVNVKEIGKDRCHGKEREDIFYWISGKKKGSVESISRIKMIIKPMRF